MAKRGTPEDIKRQRKLLSDKEAIKIQRLKNAYKRMHPRAQLSDKTTKSTETKPKKVTPPKIEPKTVKPPEKLKALPSSRAPAIVKNVRTIADFVDSYNKLPPEKQKAIDDRLAKANKEKWNNYKKAFGKPQQIKEIPEAQQVEKIVKVAGSNKNVDNFTKAISKAMRFVGMRALGPALLLVPDRPAGDPDELEKLRKIQAAGFKPTEAGRKRAVPGASKKMGGGKIKKNYSKGGGVRSAKY